MGIRAFPVKYVIIWAAVAAFVGQATPATAATVTVKLNRHTATVHAADPALAFTATVSNATDKTVTWKVNNMVGGNSTIGTIDAGGKFTAPAVAPSPNTVTVTAVSNADPTQSDSATVTLLNAVPTIGSLDTTQINTKLAFKIVITGTHFQSDATVTLDDGTAVTTKFDSATQLEITGTSSSAAGKQIHLTISNPGPGATLSQPRTITVLAPVTVTVEPKTKTIRGGTTLNMSAHVANNKDQAVTWSVNGTTGGSDAVGKIDAAGAYTAPVIIPGPSVTITAKSVADPTASDSAVVTLQNPIPVITNATSPITADAPFNITITGTGFAKGATAGLGSTALAVTWVDSTKLTATGTVPPPVGGMLALTVTNPDPGGATSNAFAITVNNGGTMLGYKAAKRFLEQATWGPTPASIEHLQAIGIDKWLAEQFDPSVTPISQYAPPIDDTSGLGALQKEFFKNGLSAPDQLRQRVAFALSQIVVVSGLKLPKYAQMMPYQQMLLNDAFGTYRQLLKDVSLSPAMGHYLDMVNNDKPTATTSPNENYARELMQLFTIGLVQLNPTGKPDAPPVPTYTEDDVHAMARVFTGWTYPPCLNASKWVNPPCWQGNLVPFQAHHDMTDKTVLGTVIHGGTPETELDDALAVIEGYKPKGIPNIAPFVALRLIEHLVTSNPSTSYVSRIANVYATTNGDLKQIVTAILKDPEAGFGNGGADLPPTQGHLREPVFFALSVLRALGATYLYSPPLATYTGGMGQDLFNPNSVFNYYSPLYHLPDTPPPNGAPEFQIMNQTTAFARANYVYRAVHNQLSNDIQLDLTNFKKLASDPPNLINAAGIALLGGPPAADMVTAITPAITATTDVNTRAMNALYLIAVASEYQVQR